MALVKDSKAAVILCDHAFQDIQGKWCLIGVFDRIYGKAFPLTGIKFFIFFQLRDLDHSEGFKFRLEVVDNSADEQGNMRGDLITGLEGSAIPPQGAPKGLSTMAAAVPAITIENGKAMLLTFPRPGIYDLNLIVNGELHDNAQVKVEQTA